MNDDRPFPATSRAAAAKKAAESKLTKTQRARRLLNPALPRMATCDEVERFDAEVGDVIDFDGAI